jgi:hypothetical protein
MPTLLEFQDLTSGIATITGANISNLHSNNLFAQSGIITDLSGTQIKLHWIWYNYKSL